jgi:hypothetical protein
MNMGKSKDKDPRLEAMLSGRPYTWTVAEGGDLASMRAVIRHGQPLTLSPVSDPAEIRAGDIVYLKWHNGHMMHLVQEIQDGRFLIVNSVGKINGWVDGSDILGRITQKIDPPARPDVPTMLNQLDAAYHRLLAKYVADAASARRLLSIVDDLRWYAARLGPDRLDKQPRSNKWSFQQNLWYFSRQAEGEPDPGASDPLCYFIDRGEQCVGLAAEIVALMEYKELY